MAERFPPDEGALAVLDALGADPTSLLGRGGEATVYALDDARVLRIQRPGASESSVRARADLIDELQASAHLVSFAIPRVLELAFVAERWITVEARLPGVPLDLALCQVGTEARSQLVERYLSAVAELGALSVERPFFGELHEGDPVRAGTWRGYLEHRARRSLVLGGEIYSRVNVDELTAPFEEPGTSAFVYLDAYPGNVLVSDGRVSAILDFGGGVLVGDPRFNALAAASYLSGDDRSLGEAWLAEHGIGNSASFRRWLAAYWAFARDDETLAAWCRSVLVGEAGPSASRSETEREELVALVRRIVDASGSASEIDAWIEELERRVPHPALLELVFYGDKERTPAEIVDLALSYRPTRLGEGNS